MRTPAVEIPIPPSANHIWQMVTRRTRAGTISVSQIRSKSYRAWLNVAVPLLKLGMPKLSGGDWFVCLHLVGGKNFPPSRDLDNCIKPVVDALRYAEILEDDTIKQVTGVQATYENPEKRLSRQAVLSVWVVHVSKIQREGS